MRISATVTSTSHDLKTIVSTNEKSQSLPVPSKTSGAGSSVNGGELLMLAIATCYCNDIYREAAKRNIIIEKVAVECTSTFGMEGEAGSNIVYSVDIQSPASPDKIDALIKYTDTIAEIHKTIRNGTAVTLITQHDLLNVHS